MKGRGLESVAVLGSFSFFLSFFLGEGTNGDSCWDFDNFFLGQRAFGGLGGNRQKAWGRG